MGSSFGGTVLAMMFIAGSGLSLSGLAFLIILNEILLVLGSFAYEDWWISLSKNPLIWGTPTCARGKLAGIPQYQPWAPYSTS